MPLHLSLRPTKFEQVLGNIAVVQSLQNVLKKKDRPHVYLFHGPAGCGKTTLARLVKKKIKCSDADFREINAADKTGIEHTREIIRSMRLRPMAGPCRAYLIDECHMLSSQAQDNLLKDLEEPPDHVYFLLCTTEPGKLKKTTRSRCSEYALKPLTDAELEELICRVEEKEGCKIPKEVRKQVTQDCQGSARQLLTILDKVVGLDKKEMLAAATLAAEESAETIELCRILIKSSKWQPVAKVLKDLNADPEKVRYAVLGYMQSILLNGDNAKAACIMEAFSEPFYATGKPGLVLACYDAIKS